MANTRVAVKRMIDLVLVKKDMLDFVQDVRAVRGMVHITMLLLCKVRLVGTWIKMEQGVLEVRN